jgi:hypothetical protein
LRYLPSWRAYSLSSLSKESDFLIGADVETTNRHCTIQQFNISTIQQNTSFVKKLYMATQEMTMTTQEVATRLAELCDRGDFETAQRELFSPDAISIEPHPTPAFEKETKGLDAILEKGHKWNSMVEKTNSIKASKPLVAANSFAITMRMDVEMKGGRKMDMTELCVYTVKDGKIVSEQFFM